MSIHKINSVQQLFIMLLQMETCSYSHLLSLFSRCVNFLIQNGAVLKRNDSGNTPLRIFIYSSQTIDRAVLLQHIDVIKSILSSIPNADVLEVRNMKYE